MKSPRSNNIIISAFSNVDVQLYEDEDGVDELFEHQLNLKPITKQTLGEDIFR